jgi:hypothetical protein
MEIFAKQCLLDFVWLALPFAGMVAFRRFRLSAAELAANRRFKVQKRSQLFICVCNETLSVMAMCVCDPDRRELFFVSCFLSSLAAACGAFVWIAADSRHG